MRKRFLQFAARKRTIHNRPIAAIVQHRRDALPGALTLLPRVRSDRDTSDTQSAEEERSGVETRHWTGESSDHADPTVFPQRRDEFVESLPADVIDRHVGFVTNRLYLPFL